MLVLIWFVTWIRLECEQFHQGIFFLLLRAPSLVHQINTKLLQYIPFTFFYPLTDVLGLFLWSYLAIVVWGLSGYIPLKTCQTCRLVSCGCVFLLILACCGKTGGVLLQWAKKWLLQNPPFGLAVWRGYTGRIHVNFYMDEPVRHLLWGFELAISWNLSK